LGIDVYDLQQAFKYFRVCEKNCGKDKVGDTIAGSASTTIGFLSYMKQKSDLRVDLQLGY